LELFNNGIGICWSKHIGGNTWGIHTQTYPITFKSTRAINITSALDEANFTNVSTASLRALSLDCFIEYNISYVKGQINGTKFYSVIGKV